MARTKRKSSGVKASKTEGTESTSLTIEEALARLQEIVEKLESGELTLDGSLLAFEEGIELSRTCGQRLSEAEQRVEVLLDAKDLGTRGPFTPDEEMD